MATALDDKTDETKTKPDKEAAKPDIDLDEIENDLVIRSTIHDPNRWQLGTGPGIQKQTTLSYHAQRQMFHNCAVLSGIRNTILAHILRFTRRVRPGEPTRAGWRIGLKKNELKEGGGKNPKKTAISPADQKRIEEVENFFQQMYRPGMPKEVESRLRKGIDYPETGFTGFVRSIMNDSIEIDAIAFEKVRTRDGKLLTVMPIDAGTINRFLPRQNPQTGREEEDSQPLLSDVIDDSLRWMADRDRPDERACYVQVITGMPRAYYGANDLAYHYRNERTDVMYRGFGYSEAEQLVSIVSALLNCETYNANNFTNGHIPQGLLQLIGSYDKGDLEALRRDLEATGMGVQNAHRMALIVSRSRDSLAQWIAFSMSNKDMEYGIFVKWLIDLAHAVFGISPKQTGLGEGFGQPAPLSERNPEREIEDSTDRSLVRFLEFLGELLTNEIVAEFYDDLEFQWVGVNPEDESFKLQEETQRLQSGTLLPDEVRARRDEDDLPDGLGKVPVQPFLFQVWQQAQQQAQQEKMAGEPPPEGSDDRMNYFRAPMQEEEGGGQRAEGGGPEQEEEPQQDGDEAVTNMEKAHAVALQYARDYALAGWRPEE